MTVLITPHMIWQASDLPCSPSRLSAERVNFVLNLILGNWIPRQITWTWSFCPIFCSCPLLENNRNDCYLYLCLFTYFWKNYLLSSDGERRPINQCWHESQTENNPVWMPQKYCHTFWTQPKSDFLLYFFIKLCPWFKVCSGKTNGSDKHWAPIFLCMGKHNLCWHPSLVYRRLSALEEELMWLLCGSKCQGQGQNWSARMMVRGTTSILRSRLSLISGLNGERKVLQPTSFLAGIHLPPVFCPCVLVKQDPVYLSHLHFNYHFPSVCIMLLTF